MHLGLPLRRRRWAALMLLIVATLGVGPIGTSAQTSELRRCDLGDTWPNTPGALAGYVFLGHTIPDRFGALRIAVDRVFDGNVPSEVLIVRSCLDHVWFDDGQLLLVAASGSLAETPLDDGGPRRLWLTQNRAAIWQVGETGRLKVAGQEERADAPDWLLDLRFVADVVRAIMGEEAPGAEAFQPGEFQVGASIGIPPLVGPDPSGPRWYPATDDGGRGAVGAITPWRGGFVALGREFHAGDDGRWVVWTSPDGLTWRETMGKLAGLTRDVYGARLIADRRGILVVAPVGLRMAIWRSADGETWRRLADRPIFDRPSAITMPGEWFMGIDSVAVSRGRFRVAASWNYHDCLDCPSWSATFTSDDGLRWRRSRPAMHAFDWGLLAYTEAMGTARGFVALRTISGADPADPQCPYSSRAWRSGDGIHWRPIPHAQRLCQPPKLWEIDATADPISGSLFVLAQGYEGTPVLMRSTDGRRWSSVAVPFPDHWSIGRVAVRGDTIVLLGGTMPIVSRDGGASWQVSAGWPALLDELTAVAIGDGVIVAGVSYPTGSTTFVVDR